MRREEEEEEEEKRKRRRGRGRGVERDEGRKRGERNVQICITVHVL